MSPKKVFGLGVLAMMVVFSIIVLVSNKSYATDVQDMFSYQTNGDALQNDFIRSNVEGLFEGQKIAKKVSDQFSFEMVHLKTMHKQLDTTHLNTLERNTSININFAKQLFSRIQLGNTRQDIGTFNENSSVNDDVQNAYSLSQGWRGSLGVLDTEAYVGVVHCANNEQQKYSPIFGAKISRSFANNSQIEFHIAQEVQNGGSYTGIYGNQIFRKMIVMAKLPLMKKLSFLWDAGIGISQTSYEVKGSSTGVATMSASLEYEIGSHVKGTVGYSHRKLVDLETGLENAQGHMVSASLAIANF